MHRFGLFCLFCAFPALFSFRIVEDVKIFEQDVGESIEPFLSADRTFPDDYIKGLLSTRETDELTHCNTGCRDLGHGVVGCRAYDRDARTCIFAYLMLSDANNGRVPELNCYFRVGCCCRHCGFDRKTNFNSNEEMCGKIHGETYCFRVNATIVNDGKYKEIEGEAKMTKPRVIELGKFKMPEY